MISQMVRNECVIFAGHIDIEVSYKIFWLEVLKEVPIFYKFTLLSIGIVLIKNTPRTLRVNPWVPWLKIKISLQTLIPNYINIENTSTTFIS